MLSVGAAIDNTFDKTQILDPTQTRYAGYYVFSPEHEGWPMYKVNFEFRIGQVTKPDGRIGYDIVQTTYVKSVKLNSRPSSSWLIDMNRNSEIRTHNGESRDLWGFKVDTISNYEDWR